MELRTIAAVSENNVIGGESVYREALPLADRLEITHVHRAVEGDAFFPEIDNIGWKEIKRQNFDGFSFVTYERDNSL